MLSWLTLCRALICGHLNSGIGVGLVCEPQRPQNKLGKSSFLEANLASISRDYSYNHSQILKYRIYRWTGTPGKGETLYRNWPPPFPYILLYFIMASPFMSCDISLWNHPMSRMPAIFRLWREEATSSATSDSLQAIFIGFSSWYFKRWTNGEEASLWVSGKYRFIYFPSFWCNPIDMVNDIFDMVHLALVEEFWSMWNAVRIVSEFCPSNPSTRSTMSLALRRLGR